MGLARKRSNFKKNEARQKKVRKRVSGLRTWGDQPKLCVLGLQKRRPKARKKRYRARCAGLTPFLGVPESRVSRPGRQTVDGFGVKTFKFQKKRSETKKSKNLRPWGGGPKLGVLGLQKRRPKAKITLVKGVRD